MKQNFHIGIMGNLFSGKTTLMRALARDPYRRNLEALLDGSMEDPVEDLLFRTPREAR